MTRHGTWFALFIFLGCAQIASASCPVCESYETEKVADGVYILRLNLPYDVISKRVAVVW